MAGSDTAVAPIGSLEVVLLLLTTSSANSHQHVLLVHPAAALLDVPSLMCHAAGVVALDAMFHVYHATRFAIHLSAAWWS